jgi:8-oxo-dGTP pyrophosphatase MutT (NUDIX family)
VDRTSLLEHLDAYRPFDATETEMRDRLRAFVARQPQCFERACAEGHITASCWIVDTLAIGASQRSRVLLTWHKRLNRWLQMGGHLEPEDTTLLNAALREAREESGLENVLPVSTAIFDLDVHPIPEHKAEPAHDHYDIRFLLEANPAAKLTVSSESRDVEWVPLSGVAALNADASMLRMLAKTTRIIRR